MAMTAWKSDSSWNVCIVPLDDPVLFSDYHWLLTQAGLVFHDTLTTRESYERSARNYVMVSELETTHWDSLHALFSAPIAPIERDAMWIKPLVAAFDKGLATSKSITREQYSFMRAFEEKAFDCLITSAITPQGRTIAGCMAVARSLDEPAKNVKDWQKRLLVWNNIIAGMQHEEFKIDGDVFEGSAP